MPRPFLSYIKFLVSASSTCGFIHRVFAPRPLRATGKQRRGIPVPSGDAPKGDPGSRTPDGCYPGKLTPRVRAGRSAPGARGAEEQSARVSNLPSQPRCQTARAGFPRILAQVHQTWGWTLLLPAPPGRREPMTGWHGDSWWHGGCCSMAWGPLPFPGAATGVLRL